MNLIRGLFLFSLSIMWTAGCSKSAGVKTDSETALDTVDTNKPGDSDKSSDTSNPVDSDSSVDSVSIDSDWISSSDMDTDTSVLLELGFEWVDIEGGSYEMGSGLMVAPDDYPVPEIFIPEGPVHTVNVPSFKMGKTEVTVAQYKECVKAGGCYLPSSLQEPPIYPTTCTPYENRNNLLYSDRSNHPVNCIPRDQMKDFCRWIGGHLPSEAEWEYAARSRGKDKTYPWGEDPVSCDFAVVNKELGTGCGTGTTAPVCSKPKGNTEQGLCNMAGNVSEYVEDEAHVTYDGAPTDGSAWLDKDETSIVRRGGNFFGDEKVANVRVTYRILLGQGAVENTGFRCAK
ncbi:MAG: formylglycine-generating enzyme family protein [Deltaproteobacteria bacterium]|nr:formylglycine-generating enzyme family protein [Deltaproteobacteria bacterium]